MSKPLFVRLILCLRQAYFLWFAAFCVNSPFAADSNALPVLWTPTEISYICDSNEAEPTYQGLSVSQWIQTKTLINTNRLPLAKLLTLKQVSDADDWGTVKFELPVDYDTFTNECSLDLGIINKDGDFVECCYADCERATNGNCLVWWNINYDQPGKHDIRVRLSYSGAALHWDEIKVIGPACIFIPVMLVGFLKDHFV